MRSVRVGGSELRAYTGTLPFCQIGSIMTTRLAAVRQKPRPPRRASTRITCEGTRRQLVGDRRRRLQPHLTLLGAGRVESRRNGTTVASLGRASSSEDGMSNADEIHRLGQLRKDEIGQRGREDDDLLVGMLACVVDDVVDLRRAGRSELDAVEDRIGGQRFQDLNFALLALPFDDLGLLQLGSRLAIEGHSLQPLSLLLEGDELLAQVLVVLPGSKIRLLQLLEIHAEGHELVEWYKRGVALLLEPSKHLDEAAVEILDLKVDADRGDDSLPLLIFERLPYDLDGLAKALTILRSPLEALLRVERLLGVLDSSDDARVEADRGIEGGGGGEVVGELVEVLLVLRMEEKVLL